MAMSAASLVALCSLLCIAGVCVGLSKSELTLQSVFDVFPGNWCHQVQAEQWFSVLLLVDEV